MLANQRTCFILLSESRPETNGVQHAGEQLTQLTEALRIQPLRININHVYMDEALSYTSPRLYMNARELIIKRCAFYKPIPINAVRTLSTRECYSNLRKLQWDMPFRECVFFTRDQHDSVENLGDANALRNVEVLQFAETDGILGRKKSPGGQVIEEYVWRGFHQILPNVKVLVLNACGNYPYTQTSKEVLRKVIQEKETITVLDSIKSFKNLKHLVLIGRPVYRHEDIQNLYNLSAMELSSFSGWQTPVHLFFLVLTLFSPARLNAHTLTGIIP